MGLESERGYQIPECRSSGYFKTYSESIWTVRAPHCLQVTSAGIMKTSWSEHKRWKDM